MELVLVPGHHSTQRVELHLLPIGLLLAALLATLAALCCVVWRRKPDVRNVRLPSGAAVSIRNL